MGVYLRTSELSLFKDHESAIKPYIGFARYGSKEPKKIICHQLVAEPCPLYNRTSKRCTQYESRPIACKAYPFDYFKDKLVVETGCSWVKKFDIRRGIAIPFSDLKYADEIRNDFYNYALMRSLNLPVVFIFDVMKNKWMKWKETGREELGLRC